MTYIPGNWWSIDPKTGFKVRVSELAQEPVKGNDNSGNWVWKNALDPVHPQEYVKGVEDDPSVPLSFPAVEQTLGQTTLYSASSRNATQVHVTDAPEVNDPIGIEMDNGAMFWSFVTDVEILTGAPLIDADGIIVRDVDGNIVTTADPYGGAIVTIGSYLHYDASAGNTVLLPGINNEEWQ